MHQAARRCGGASALRRHAVAANRVVRAPLARRPWQALCPSCSLATHSGNTPPSPELVRDFIWRALYDSQSGYFATTTCLHAPVAPLDFTKMRGKSEYTEKLGELYAAEDEAWLTPVEIFAVRPTALRACDQLLLLIVSVCDCVVSQPWYSYAVAQWILSDFRRAAALSPATAPKLCIVEAGGGAGTHARHVLDYLRDQAPDVYATASYTDVELSAAMGQRATETVERAGHRNFAVVAGDITDTSSRWTVAAEVGGEELCYVILMEVLDNLPHDKVRFSRRRESHGIETHQVVVRVDGETRAAVEDAEPLTDPLLRRALEIDRIHEQSEVDDLVKQVERHPDYASGRASGEGILGSLLVRCISSHAQWTHLSFCSYHVIFRHHTMFIENATAEGCVWM